MVPDRKPRSYWGLVFAAGLVAASLGQAQEQAQPAENQPPAEQPPANQIPLPVPIQIIEDEAGSLAREQREAETRQREIEDLAAQEGMNIAAQAMNEATQRMADLAVWQTKLAAIGTAALIITLGLMWHANKLTRQVGQQQTRAYVYPSFVGFFDADDIEHESLAADWATVLVKIRNYGQSPAKMARAAMSREVWAFPPPSEDRRKPIPTLDFAEDRHDMPPGNESENRLDFTLSDLDREGIESGQAALYVFGRIEYTDTFGDHHYSNFMFYSTGEDFTLGHFRTHSFGNEAT